MTEEIKEILKLHKLWLDNDPQGRRADLCGADLRGADLCAANLDYSCLPLWCGGFDINIDDRIAVQILYHLVRNVIGSINTSPEIKTLLSSNEIIAAANQFHRVNECGLLDACRQEDKNETQNLSD